MEICEKRPFCRNRFTTHTTPPAGVACNLNPFYAAFFFARPPFVPLLPTSALLGRIFLNQMPNHTITSTHFSLLTPKRAHTHTYTLKKPNLKRHKQKQQTWHRWRNGARVYATRRATAGGQRRCRIIRASRCKTERRTTEPCTTAFSYFAYAFFPFFLFSFVEVSHSIAHTHTYARAHTHT